MTIKTLFQSLILLLILMPRMVAQTPCIGLPNYADLNNTCVRCTYGRSAQPDLNVGIVPTRHTVITRQGMDPNTGNQLPLIPKGFTSSVRLGNQEVGAESESISYTFEVDPLNALIGIRFAVVFEDPAHDLSYQPRFVVRILDEWDQLVEPCAQYDVFSGEELPGFETFIANGIPVRWRPWTMLGLNLSNYVGRKIKVSFSTYDCFHSGHFGYAYFVMDQSPTTLHLDACLGDQMTLSAPEGYSTYQWTHGAITAQTTISVLNPPVHTSCLIRSATGCEFTLNAIVGIKGPDWYSDTTLFDTICQGQAYRKNGFDLPTQWLYGETMHTVTYIDINQCKASVRKFLRLKVHKTLYEVTADLCAGQSYVENGFRFMRPSPGIYKDTLRFTTNIGCDSLVCLTLRVSPSFDMPLAIDGPQNPCMLKPINYGLSNAFGMGTYQWITPKGCYILRGQGTPNIEVKFSDQAELKDTLKLFLSNGCGSGTLKESIEPMPAYFLTFIDSACAEAPYEGYDFKVPATDSFGTYVFVNPLESTCGCDSIRTLYLLLFPKPKASILSDQEVLCIPDKTTLSLLVEGIKPKKPKVRVGDVLCTDGAIMPLSEFQMSGKTADAVVFFVDRSGYHGWASAIDTLSRLPMCTIVPEVDIPGLPSYNYLRTREASKDTNGYANTLLWRAAGTAAQYPMPWKVDMANGWYIPALGQMSMLLLQVPVINPVLEALGGTQVPTHLNVANGGKMSGWTYSVSTEDAEKYHWVLSEGFGLNQGTKANAYVTRPAKSF